MKLFINLAYIVLTISLVHFRDCRTRGNLRVGV